MLVHYLLPCKNQSYKSCGINNVDTQIYAWGRRDGTGVNGIKFAVMRRGGDKSCGDCGE